MSRSDHPAVSNHMSPSTLAPSQSVLDLSAVAPPVPSVKRGSATNLLSGQTGSITAVQEHENETAEIVIVCEPQGTSLMMGGLHPRASLYERPVNLDAAKSAHANFRQVMRDAGVKVCLPWSCLWTAYLFKSLPHSEGLICCTLKMLRC